MKKFYFLIVSAFVTEVAFATCNLSQNTIGEYLVNNYTDLKEVGVGDCSLDADYRLTANIDASDSKTENCVNSVCAGFSPIGADTLASFNGDFHGSGYVIRNLFVVDTDASFAGLFGSLGSVAVVDSLGLVDISVIGDAYVGALAGYALAHVEESYAKGTVVGNNVVGGLIGYYNGGVIEKCYSMGSVSQKDSSGLLGGLIGQMDGGDLLRSFSTANVTGQGSVAGLVGSVIGGTLEYDYSTGNLYGHVGGGLMVNNWGTVRNSYSTSSIMTFASAEGNVLNPCSVGGMAYLNNAGTIESSYAAGSLTCLSAYRSGGFVGFNNNSGTITESYWDVETTGFTSGIGIGTSGASVTGLSTPEMRQSSKLDSLGDFSTAGSWIIREDSTYAGLRDLDNAPFAFADRWISTSTFDLVHLLENDYDIETVQENLILHVDSITLGATDSVSTFSFPKSAAEGDSTIVVYRVGEIRTVQNDTLWGNRVTSILVYGKSTESGFSQNTPALTNNIFLRSIPNGIYLQGIRGRLDIYTLQGAHIMSLNITRDGVYYVSLRSGAYMARSVGQTWKIQSIR